MTDDVSQVALAYLHPGHVQHAFMASVLQTQMRHPELAIWPIRSGPIAIPKSRNAAVARMLADDRLDWLWFADSDMGFPATMLGSMLAVADEHTRPVLTAPYLAVIDGEADGMGGLVPRVHPAIYEWEPDGRVTSWPRPLPGHQLLRVGACGAGMLLIHRRALKAAGAEPFSRIGDLGEDLSFCRRLADAGVPIHAHTGLTCTHTKSIPLS